VQVFRQHNVNVVMAEYGTTAVHALPACRRLGIPLVAHFHGYDASNRAVLEKYRAAYSNLFQHAAAIVVVSRAMQRKLISLGAHPDKVHYNPCGVDCQKFAGADPANASPTLLAVGRFIDKKAPQLTIRAFARAFERCPEARLRMIGDGQLLDACLHLARELGIAEAVTFLGSQSPTVVMEEMRRARAFVQHSVEAPSGDCEGTPVSVLEAGASGLAVVSTRHGGIPDVVLEGATGLLVDEHDVDGMAAHMVRMVKEPALAAQLGGAARQRMKTCFSFERSITTLVDIVDACVQPKAISSTGAVTRRRVLAHDAVER
jgi:glycosyltransferase involved in cell wall biosynthesis